jgi:hypothetical protein
LEALEDRALPSISFVFDYRVDTHHFFISPAKRQLLELAGRMIGRRLQDQLSAITPDVNDHWGAGFSNPSTGRQVTLQDLSIPANTILIFAGGSPQPGDQVGEGGPGSGFPLFLGAPTLGAPTLGDPTWGDTIEARGQAGALGEGFFGPATDFAPAVGELGFNTADHNWYFGVRPPKPGSHTTDFLSVALHELGHVLGIGSSPSWFFHVSPHWTFTGPASEASYGRAVPLQRGGEHWAQSDRSHGREPVMTPTVLDGTRKTFTALDWAGLEDIGWQVK